MSTSREFPCWTGRETSSGGRVARQQTRTGWFRQWSAFSAATVGRDGGSPTEVKR